MGDGRGSEGQGEQGGSQSLHGCFSLKKGETIVIGSSGRAGMDYPADLPIMFLGADATQTK
jgi:hypothetical protein